MMEQLDDRVLLSAAAISNPLPLPGDTTQILIGLLKSEVELVKVVAADQNKLELIKVEHELFKIDFTLFKIAGQFIKGDLTAAAEKKAETLISSEFDALAKVVSENSLPAVQRVREAALNFIQSLAPADQTFTGGVTAPTTSDTIT
jgi:hypothetical protein